MTERRTGQSTDRTRVLYVDDAEPAAALSAGEDVRVETAATVAGARDRLDDDRGRVDCVVSEYDLPDSDGLALLESVRHDHPNLPFVVYTGSGSEAIASEAIGMGATDYVPKTAGGETLAERVDRAVATARVETDSGVSGARMRELTNAFPDVAFILDEDGRYLEVLSGPETESLRAVDQEQLIGKRIHDAFDDAEAERYLEHIRTTLESGTVETIEYRTETETGERWYEGRTAPLRDAIDGRDAVVWVARDVTDRRGYERKLAQRRDELARLNRINELINSTLQSLIEATNREEIERAVCEELADSPFYQFAWTGPAWVKDERMRPSVVAGIDRDELVELLDATNAVPRPDNSFVHVLTENESVVIHDVADSTRISDREREAMLDLGMSSAALVPLTYGDTNYGVLAISGGYPNAFGDGELAGLEALAEIVGFVINAVQNRNLIFSDSAVELTFRVEDSDSAFGRLSADLDCRVELEGIVPASEDRLIEYVSLTGAPTDAVLDRAAEMDAFETYRVVHEDGEECLLETEPAWSGVDQLVQAAAVVKSAIAENGDVTFVSEAPSETEVRNVVERLREMYPDVELTGKREVDRPVRTMQEMRQTIADALTDKQQSALRAAYFAGYYEYPRESTAEEVAASLGITSPTLHQHLRAAQCKLVGAFLDSWSE
ncbi:PAS sensor protein [Halobacteriales archaeon QS_1_67_19]|nr:MAG: PAS sensor protein [Halobacteriales archaeon QS_1_67_19]